MKYKIRAATITYSKRKAKENREREANLLKRIASLERQYYESNSACVLQELNDSRTQLNHIYDFKLQGIIVRSRARWVENGEKSTKCFLNLEKRHKESNVIRNLITAEGRTLSAGNDILSEIRSFYQTLYRSEEVYPDLIFQNLPVMKS